MRAALHRRTLATASAADVELAVFAAHGRRDVALALMRESHELRDHACDRVRGRLRERFGVRSPLGGLIAQGCVVLLLAATAPLGLQRAHRYEVVPSDAAGIATIVIGAALVLLPLLGGLRPVARSVVRQVILAAGMLVLGAAVGLTTADGPPAAYIIGGALALLAVLLALISRRDRVASADLDAAVGTARQDAAGELTRRRERLLAELPARLAACGLDPAAMRRTRAAALSAFAAEGSRAADDAPDAPPGAYIIREQTAQR